MVGVIFHVGGQRYALPARQLVEVVPMVSLRHLPSAPAFVPGAFVFRGESAAVIDLCMRLTGQPAVDRLSSRLLMVHVRGRVVGLLAERVTEAVKIDEAALEPAPVGQRDAPYLGKLWRDGAQLTQVVELAQIMDAELEQQLFGEGGA